MCIRDRACDRELADGNGHHNRGDVFGKESGDEIAIYIQQYEVSVKEIRLGLTYGSSDIESPRPEKNQNEKNARDPWPLVRRREKQQRNDVGAYVWTKELRWYRHIRNYTALCGSKKS